MLLQDHFSMPQRTASHMYSSSISCFTLQPF